MITPKCNWPGQSCSYTFEILTMDGGWNPVPGVYIFSKEASSGVWHPGYVGETENFQSRLNTNHEKWSRAILWGATHVHACVVLGSEFERKRIESELILILDPPLNRKLSVPLRTIFST